MIIIDSRMLLCVVLHCFMMTLVLTLKMKRGHLKAIAITAAAGGPAVFEGPQADSAVSAENGF
jgi:hypothetical protein